MERSEDGVDRRRDVVLHDREDLRIDRLSIVRRVGKERPFVEPAGQLDACEPLEEPVAEGPGLGVGLDDADHLPQVRVVAHGLDPTQPGVRVILPPDVVVADVVREHGDRAGREIGADDEHQVLEPAATLRESQAVLLDERPAEELVRRQAVEERRLPERGPVHVGEEQVPRHPAMEPGHLAEDDIRVVPARHRVQPLQGLGPEPIVVVEEEDVFAAGRGQPDVARLAGPAGVLLVDHPEVRMPRGEGIESCRGLVGRAVVDEDALDLVRAQRLVQDRLDASVDVRPRIPDRDDDAHLDRHVGQWAPGDRRPRHATSRPVVDPRSTPPAGRPSL